MNFGVADSGAVVLVTNEGNGRLTTTTPRIHVAVMGIERVVETLDDLGVLLKLLARSATGQRLSVYTTLCHRPGAAGRAGWPGRVSPGAARQRPLAHPGRRVRRDRCCASAAAPA